MKKITAQREKSTFEKKVYDALKKIPKGKVTTYKLLGNFIGCKSAQAIGQALTRNPNAPDIPCHRVIKTDLSLGGYAFGEEKKRSILAIEGVVFYTEKGRWLLAHSSQIWDFLEKE